MTEQNLTDARCPMEILAEEIAKRPIPAIEKPLGRRGEQTTPVVIFDTKLAESFSGWNDTMRGRERG